MINTYDLCKSFEKFQAVQNVTLEVKPGEVLALLGPNGAGKTTTVRMMTSVLRPTSGRAVIAGYDVVERPQKVRSSVGVLTEHSGLYKRMQGHEYLDFFGEVYGLSPSERKKRSARLLDHFGLTEAASRRIGEYSKGMRQKLALARTLIHEPPVLLLDEPTSAMDPESTRLVRDAIKELRSEERAIIICTHNLVEAEELADKIAIIRKGSIIANGTISEIKTDLLGQPSYEVRLAERLNGRMPVLPEEVDLLEHDENRLRFHSSDPIKYNRVVLQNLIAQDFSVVTLNEVSRTLEEAYLAATRRARQAEEHNA